MKTKNSLDNTVVSYARWIIKHRIAVVMLTVFITGLLIWGGKRLTYDNSYRAFFSKDNPQLLSFEALQNMYTKNDNILIVVAPDSKNVFTPDVLDVVETLTRDAWKIPHATRVDAITNYQNTWAFEDALIVEDLISDSYSKTERELNEARIIALNEPLLINRLISPSGHVTGINVTLQFPGESVTEGPDAVAYTRKLTENISAQYENIDIYLTGTVMLDNAFSEGVKEDLNYLIPIMYLCIVIIMFLLLRSVSGSLVTMMIVGLATAAAMGFAGWTGIAITPASASAPLMIMTLALADCIHLLVTILRKMRDGLSKFAALEESLRINMRPIFLTSLTTCIGYLTLNFSDSPPFHDLGNLTAFGMAIAFLLSVSFLPAAIAVLPVNVRASDKRESNLFDDFAVFVIANKKYLLYGSACVVLFLAAFIPANEVNDQFVEYFDEDVQFRTDTDFTMNNLTGIYYLGFSLNSGENGGVSNPDYLAKLDEFAEWFRKDSRVKQIYSFSDIMKQLNKHMNSSDPAYYRIPESKELAAQYLLLYELSLPYGLDLNNQITVDKSETRFMVTLGDVSTNEIRDIAAGAEKWLKDNAPAPMTTNAASTAVMFSHIFSRNIKSMLGGTTIALILISFLLIFALKSLKFGLLSLIPNLVPGILAFGLWGMIVGEVGLAVSGVSAMTLGIVVDDTVHFLSKYMRARFEQSMNAEESIRFAFSTVGRELLFTSIILISGFMVLTQSSFKINAELGMLTSVIIAFAILADFLLLPSLLLVIDNTDKNERLTLIRKVSRKNL